MYSFITDNLLASYVLPDHYFYPMVPNAPDYNIPVGILEVTVVECKCGFRTLSSQINIRCRCPLQYAN